MTKRGLIIILLILNSVSFAAILLEKPQGAEKALPGFPGVATLQLLSEQDASKGLNDARQSMLPVASENGLQCFSLGPFSSQGDVRRVMYELDEEIKQASQRNAREQQYRGYWVYLKAFESRGRALEVARDLSNQGIRDYYVVTAGDRENMVSLGLFADRENARRRQSQLQSLGYDAQLEGRRDEVQVYYLDYMPVEDADSQWQQAVKDIPGIRRRSIDCPAQG